MNALVAGVPVMLGIAVLGVNRVRGDARPVKRREGPPPLLGVRRRTDDATVEPDVAADLADGDGLIVAATDLRDPAYGVSTAEAEEAELSEAACEAPGEAADVSSAVEDDTHDDGAGETQPLGGVVVVAPQLEPAAELEGDTVLAPSRRQGIFKSAVAVVRRFVRRDGVLDEAPVAVAEDGMLEVFEEEHLPDTDAWEATSAEREAGFEAARAAAAAREAELRAEDERRELEARKEAILALEREREANRGWWVQLDEEARSESERMALVSSLGLVRMPWAHRLVLRALREDESIRVRARAIGALARGGWLDDPEPFNEIFAQNDRVLNLAVREALTPHQDRLWVRNLFA